MKKLLLASAFSLCTVLASAQMSVGVQTTGPDIGRAVQMQGKYVFYYNQPVAPYDVAFTFQSTPQFNGCPNAQEMANACLTAALLEAGAQTKAFDAIIIGTGSRDVAIKFRGTDNTDLARVQKQEGKQIFILSTPVGQYTDAKPVKVVVWEKWASGTCYNTTKVVSLILKKAPKDSNAIIYSGTTAEAIVLK